jgi:hypothetical protein
MILALERTGGERLTVTRSIGGAVAMRAAGFIWLHRSFRSALAGRTSQRVPFRRRPRTTPIGESLEAITLLSTGSSLLSSVVAQLDHANHGRFGKHVAEKPVHSIPAADPGQAPVTAPAQTVSIGDTLTNFTNQPLSPPLSLFNPSLGTLLSVSVSHSARLQGNVTSQNLSATSPTVITATYSGSYQIDGLNQAIAQPTRTLTSDPTPAGEFGSPTDTVTFPPFVLSDSSTTTETDPASLAFFTGSSSRSAITLTMTATAAAAASAPNGNLLTTTMSTGSATVTVAYTYLPASCPTVVGIGRIGVHHQRTELIVTYDGAVDVTKAEDPADYTVITRSGMKIPIKSATFNPATNSVTLIPAQRLNVHLRYLLAQMLPCPNEQTGETVVTPFGGKRSLIGFHNHRGEFVSVKNGRITGVDDRRGELNPVHKGKIEKPARPHRRRNFGFEHLFLTLRAHLVDS